MGSTPTPITNGDSDMKLRDIVLHVCMNNSHREMVMHQRLREFALDGAVILKRSKTMAIVGEEEHIFKTEEEIQQGRCLSYNITRVEGFVPESLKRQIRII